MEQLIKITEENGKKAVSARELHNFLGSKQAFADWIKNRIEKYDLVENEDFIVFHKVMNNSNGGRPLKEYALSIDCAKELSMVEGNERGKQARRYFIACEQKLQEIVQHPELPTDYLSALKALVVSEEQKLALQVQNEELEKVAEKAIEESNDKQKRIDRYTDSRALYAISEVAQIFQLSAIKLNKILSEASVIRKVNGSWVAYAGYKEWFSYSGPYSQFYFTQKGRFECINWMKEKGYSSNIYKN